jgi:glycosyl transferase family 2
VKDREHTGIGIAVIIATKDRPQQVARLLADLRNQTRWPTEVIISAVTHADLPSTCLSGFEIRHITGAAGLTKQRNAGLAALKTDPLAVAFLDDDLRIGHEFLERAEIHFRNQASLAGLNGTLLADGAARGLPVSNEDASELLGQQPVGFPTLTPRRALYGCNMLARTTFARVTAFDESLPAYGWLEDRDFGLRLGRLGATATASDMLAVHLGVSSGGRTAHSRYGYSQIANSVYLYKKGTLDGKEALRLCGRSIAANVRGTLLHSKDREARRARLSGNMVALKDMPLNRLSPSRILEL